ncbi:MAG: hypothetical protein E6I91_15895 [Chloroflexi bacterium]|nr:MAG: hypothetical protein E6I91_15895 [Chloroflexota bacterium]
MACTSGRACRNTAVSARGTSPATASVPRTASSGSGRKFKHCHGR